MQVLGIDIGGSGIKGAPVDTDSGEFLAERVRIPTPEPSHPLAVARAVEELRQQFEWRAPIGCTVPGVVQHGVVKTAANIDPAWIETDAVRLFNEITGCPIAVLNDADAAGMAEMQFGAGRGRSGVVIIITIGTGIGTALFTNGRLVPNTELGHLEIRGKDAERRASDAARKRKNLTWEEWAGRFNEYLSHIERLFWPDLIILGGGGSKKYELFRAFLTTRAEMIPALLRNDAGIVGAALAGGAPHSA